MSDQRRVRALVLADRHEVALPACRALARAGHVVGAAASIPDASVFASRAVSFRHVFPGSTARQADWTSALRDAIGRNGYDVVLACNDIDVVRLLEAGPVVPSVPSMTRSQAVVLDKAALAACCARAGVPYPETDVPATAADDARAAESAPPGAVVKAARPAILTAGGVVHVAGIAAGRDAAGRLAAMRRLRAAGLQPIVQHRVAGEKVQAAIIRRGGVTSCSVAALVERAPAETTLRRLAAAGGIGGECVAALERVADEAGYEGLIQAEFLVAAPGPCLVDLNPRLWGGLSFGELAGLRIAERAVLDALGLPPPPMSAESPGRRYHHLARELTFIGRRPGAVRAVVSQWSRRDLWDVPPPSDLRPHVLHLWQQARGRLLRPPEARRRRRRDR